MDAPVGTPTTQEWADYFARSETWETLPVRRAKSTKRLTDMVHSLVRPTVLQLEEGEHCGHLSVSSPAPVVLDGMGRRATLAAPRDHGGNVLGAAVTVDGNAMFVLRGVVIEGGVVVQGNARCELVDCVVTCEGVDTPDVAAAAVALRSSARLTRCEITGGGIGVAVVPQRSVPLRIEGCTVSGAAVGILVDGPSPLRAEGNTIRECGSAGVVWGGCAGGNLRGNCIEDCAGYGVVFEARATAWAQLNTVRRNARGGVLLCSAAHPVVLKNTVEHDAGPAIRVAGQVSATLQSNTVTLGPGRGGIAVLTCDVSDAVVENNTIWATGEGCAAVVCTASSTADCSANVIHAGTNVAFAGGEWCTLTHRATAGSAAAATTTPLADVPPEVRAAADADCTWHDLSTCTEPPPRLVRAPAPPSALRQLSAVDEATRRNVSTSVATRIAVSWDGARPSSPNDTAAMRRAASLRRSNTSMGTRAASPPASPRGRSDARPRSAPLKRTASASPTAITSSAPPEAEVKELRRTVAQLRAQLALKAAQSPTPSPRPGSAAGPPSRPGSAAQRGPASRPISAQNGRARSVTPRSRSAAAQRDDDDPAPFERVVHVGRFGWDAAKRRDFMAGKAPLHEARYECEPLQLDGTMTERLHDAWLRSRQQARADAAQSLINEERARSASRLSLQRQRECARRLHDASQQHARETAEKLRGKYLASGPRQVRRLTTPARDEAELCARIADALHDYEKAAAERREKLNKKLLFNPVKATAPRSPREVAAYGASLHESHRNTGLASSVGVAAPRARATPTPPQKRIVRTRAELERYAASLAASHKDAFLAADAANASGFARGPLRGASLSPR